MGEYRAARLGMFFEYFQRRGVLLGMGFGVFFEHGGITRVLLSDFVQIPRAFFGGTEVFREHFQSALVLQVHRKRLRDPYVRFDGPAFERAKKDPYRGNESVDSEEYPFDGARIGTVRGIVRLFFPVRNERGKVSGEIGLVVAPFVDEAFEDGQFGIRFGRHQSHVHAAERFGIRSGPVGPVVGSERHDLLEVPVYFIKKPLVGSFQYFERAGVRAEPFGFGGFPPSDADAVFPIVRMGVERAVRVSVGFREEYLGSGYFPSSVGCGNTVADDVFRRYAQKGERSFFNTARTGPNRCRDVGDGEEFRKNGRIGNRRKHSSRIDRRSERVEFFTENRQVRRKVRRDVAVVSVPENPVRRFH